MAKSIEMRIAEYIRKCLSHREPDNVGCTDVEDGGNMFLITLGFCGSGNLIQAGIDQRGALYLYHDQLPVDGDTCFDRSGEKAWLKRLIWAMGRIDEDSNWLVQTKQAAARGDI